MRNYATSNLVDVITTPHNIVAWVGDKPVLSFDKATGLWTVGVDADLADILRCATTLLEFMEYSNAPVLVSNHKVAGDCE